MMRNPREANLNLVLTSNFSDYTLARHWLLIVGLNSSVLFQQPRKGKVVILKRN